MHQRVLMGKGSWLRPGATSLWEGQSLLLRPRGPNPQVPGDLRASRSLWCESRAPGSCQAGVACTCSLRAQNGGKASAPQPSMLPIRGPVSLLPTALGPGHGRVKDLSLPK